VTARRDADPDPARAPDHVPVLLEEALHGLALRPDGVYLDATFGRGGHSRAILERLGPDGRLVAIDRDPTAADAAAAIHHPRFSFATGPFSELADVLRGLGVAGLGVSSPQLDDPARGFSFRLDGPLDMRMDPTRGISAAEWIAAASERELARVIAEYGEERAATGIARAIVAERGREPIATTRRLAAIVAAAVRRSRGARREDIDPATRTFQALRIHVNDELGEIARALGAVLPLLRPRARLVVISFHSLEDRIVKRFIREQSGRGDVDPRLARLPVVLPAPPALLRPVGGLVRAGDEEASRNPRARSARLRIAERLPDEAFEASSASSASSGRRR
jgi:16S rRNA (cytosine1402-N4)-methyltransferase